MKAKLFMVACAIVALTITGCYPTKIRANYNNTCPTFIR